MNKDNQQQDRPIQKPKRPQKKGNPPLAVDNDAHYAVYLKKLQHLAVNEIPVMMNPKLHSVEKLTGDARAMGHFIKISYNAEAMSHMIINVMPSMDTMMKLSDGSETYEDMTDQEAIDSVLDAMLDRKEEERKASE